MEKLVSGSIDNLSVECLFFNVVGPKNNTPCRQIIVQCGILFVCTILCVI